MSSPSETSFVPKDNVPRTFGRTTVYVYPEVDTTMSYSERSYAFMVTKSALEAAGIPHDQMLQILAGITRTAPLVSVLQSKFIDYAKNAIREAGNFEVLSYHGRNGRIINNAETVEGNLKPTENATNPDRRPADLMYAKLSCDLLFVAIDAENTSSYPFTFFVRLPTENRIVQNSQGGNVNLNTFHGPADWHSIVDQPTLDAIWDHPKSYRKPFTLNPPAITDVNADAVIESEASVLEKLALEAAWPTITKKVYDQLCPNVLGDPASVIQAIHQVTKNAEGEDVTLSVEQYFTSVQRMTNFLPTSGNWTIDVTLHFQTHLREDIRQQMKANNYNYNAGVFGMDPYSQLMSLQNAYAQASIAETAINRVRKIAQDTVSQHSFHTKVNQSVAEDTIQRYVVTCWGCDQTGHSYASKQGQITCPNKDKPGVKEKAEKARKDFNDRQRKKKNDLKKGSKRNANTMLSEALGSMTRDEIKALIASGSPSKKAKDSPVTTFVVAFEVNQAPGAKPLLPISIEPNLPHIVMPIGQNKEASTFSLLLAYDTCAACNVGYLGHHLPIAEKFPQLVKSLVYAADKYAPLTLSGIVSDKEGSITDMKPTATLPAVIEYWLPFLTKEGHRTTLKIALGQSVSVNTIIGMPIIRPAKLSLDLVDDVVESGVLDTEPFPVAYRPTIQSMPDFSKINSDSNKLLLTHSSLGHITAEDATACRVALTNQDCPVEPPAKRVTIEKALVDTDEPVFPPSKETTIVAKKSPTPISVPKAKWRAKTASMWKEPVADEADHPDFDYIFQTRTGNSIRKTAPHAFPAPNPNFHQNFDPEKDTKELEANLVLDKDLSVDLRNRVHAFVREHWDVFREDGVTIPVRGYEMVIDTGNFKPIAVRKPHYGLHESPIMQKTIDKLLELGFIKHDTTSPWGFRITLAPKPHQESVTDIDEYIWRFCINYIRLNMMTKPAEYPIPRCDDAVMYGFEGAVFFILLDAYSGYHQVPLSSASSAKTSFYAPHGRKYCWVVMPFGLRNCPVVFIAMMHDLQELWVAMARREGIDVSNDNGTTIIMDDTFLFGVSIDNIFTLAKCVCLIARKYHLTWKLKKSRWLPVSVEFVGVDIHADGGNTPAESKDILLHNWKVPSTPREVLGFIGFAIFYLRWCPWFELKIKPLRAIISDHPLDYKFSAQDFDSTAVSIFQEVRDHILSKPILQRASIHKRFYLKTDFSSLGLGFALCQPDDTAESLAAMKREDEGGECEFEFCLSKLRLKPIAFGSRKTVGNEKHFHSHPGESLAASWATTKNRHFLWGRPFTLITDCRALIWLMDYKGHHHAVRRLQLEMLGYWFSIANRPGRMLEDADYFSRLGQDIHIDPLLKDYLSFARQAYLDGPPSSDPINEQNMPGRRAKRTKMDDTDGEGAEINFAHVEWEDQEIDLTPPTNKDSRRYSNVPIMIFDTTEVQKASDKNFSYITETALRLSKFQWCLSQPGHGHFIEASRSLAIQFEPTIVCDTDQSCRNTMQTRYSSSFIFDTLDKMASFCSNKPLPSIQGYYANCEEPGDNQTGIRSIKTHEQIISSLKQRANLEIIVIEISWRIPSSQYSSLKTRLQSQGWELHEKSISSAEHFSDRISAEFDLIIGLSANYFHTKVAGTLDHLSPTPAVPNSMSPKILVEFNDAKFALPHIGDLFTVEPSSIQASRKPSVEYIIRQKQENLTPGFDTGYQIYNKDSPAPLPSLTRLGLFGSLFGISFPNPNYRADNKETKERIRAIAITEYTSFFGYDLNYSAYLNGQPNVTTALRRTLPCRTVTRIVEATNNLLRRSIDQRSEQASHSTGVDLSIPALFNGIIADQLPDESAWKSAYDNDECCATIIRLILNPSRITNEVLSKVHSTYRSAVRTSKLKWEENRLIMFEPIANSTNTVRLTIIPLDLRKHLFTAFHVNPLGGHFSLYYTLHRIRLRYHWPNMYTYIKQNIDDCVACVLRNGGNRASSELLYSFPLSAPFQAVHADAWVPGKTMSFDGYIGLMIVVCHMTGFAAIEPIKEMNSASFAKSVYTILLRYGLSHTVITDPDSKFKGQFKEAFLTLKIHHHLSARGHHDAILVERFNRFLNAGLRVFNNDRETNRVFVEGAQTLTYAWNSCPVHGTDLSRSLLTVGREFHFPIDFEANRQRSYDVTDKDKKVFADSLTDLLLKSREVYLLLIAEHRAAHREYRNAQINNPREFKLGDIVFTNVQVQSKKSSGTVQKLAYIKRGPYKIIKDYKSGSYELQPTIGRSRATIKKHGSDLYLSPQSLVPHRPTQSSDLNFGDLHKKTISQPYKIVGLEGYEPSQPWSAPAAAARLNLALLEEIPPFPTLQELDNEFDGWPESGNPFVNREVMTPAGPVEQEIIALPTSIKTKATIVADLIRSEDKLYFIAYSQERSQARKEWKLVHVNFQKSLQQHPSCLQDGRFLVEFFIEHHRDKNLDICNRRYWIEYHGSNSHKSLSVDYHILQPSQYSEATARSKQLTPYREWVNIDDSEVSLHGPFDFATLNNRKTRDRISEKDWLILSEQKSLYHNQAPKITTRAMHIDITQPIYEQVRGDPDVEERCRTFMLNMEFNDSTLKDFGA